MRILGYIIIIISVVGVASQTSSCDMCQTTYLTTVQNLSATEDTKCLAAKSYIQCLVKATGSGCDERPARLITATNEVSRVNGISGKVCSITDTCSCEVDYYKSDLYGQLKTCYASVVYNLCVIGASQLSCDGTTTNEVKGVAVAVQWVKACSGAESIGCTFWSMALVFVTMTWILK